MPCWGSPTVGPDRLILSGMDSAPSYLMTLHGYSSGVDLSESDFVSRELVPHKEGQFWPNGPHANLA